MSASESSPRFKVGDRVKTALYGLGTVTYYWRDQTLGWTYRIRPVIPELRETVLVESTLTLVSVVDQLGDLAS